MWGPDLAGLTRGSTITYAAAVAVAVLVVDKFNCTLIVNQLSSVITSLKKYPQSID